ncbi:MAG TPA: glucosaminidase domain-containing protein [Bacteroidales bacterium]|nr:glucosaminidase domain-containing protein [Bacteroidales bacterium]
MLLSAIIFAQQRTSRAEYIATWSGLAQQHMMTYGIPASIKLAQACLESDDGNSLLAREANNHFGIKCHKDWNGRTYHKDDDAEDECFRHYAKAEESFRDHSLFLTQRERYAGLFRLDPMDYRGWARGLKEAGYATNPRYPELLIRIIEENRLYRFDGETAGRKEVRMERVEQGSSPKAHSPGGAHTRINDVKAILAVAGDTYRSLAEAAGLTEWMLRKFNEVGKDAEPHEGDVVYLQPKRRRSGELTYTSRGHETLWDVSMKYGIKVKRLEKLNRMERTDNLREGQTVSLR